ncbi:MAG: YcxB family protein [Oscillospiraceae bacterium]|nr:YcxB family protein [Oscillospiraceae bacterium]
MAFESLSGIKINDFTANRAYIVADYFSFYSNTEDLQEIPKIYKWTDFTAITESKDAFILKVGENGSAEIFDISKDLIPDPAVQIRVRAIIEGVVAANPKIEYKYGRRILPPKTLCVGCEIPPEAYIATGAYKENEINNANVILKISGFDKLIWIFAPIAAFIAFVLQILYFGNISSNIIRFTVIAIFAGGSVGLTIYMFCIFGAKTLYGKILREDCALLEEITFVVCEDGFIASESEIYDFSDIVRWCDVAYFIETNQIFIIFHNNKAVFWLPKRLFPKEMHKELGDFIAAQLQK